MQLHGKLLGYLPGQSAAPEAPARVLSSWSLPSTCRSTVRMASLQIIGKRLKARPELSEEFAQSESVYFRKTGNDSVVGSGTYGKVYKAVHVYTNTPVALKKIRMEGERDGVSLLCSTEVVSC